MSWVDRRVLVLMSGPAGTGKSTVARALARRYGWVHLQTDCVRKVIHGYSPDENCFDDRDLYGKEASGRTAREMLRLARRALVAGKGVIMDGTYLRVDYRRPVVELADELGVDLICVAMHVSDDDRIRAWLDERDARGDDYSDANFDIYREHKRIYEFPRGDGVIRVESGSSVSGVVERVGERAGIG